MPKNEILENILVDKLIFGGKGLGVAPDGRKAIISGGVIPGSVIDVRVLKARKSHYEGQQARIVKKSPIEVGLQPGHQMYGGAKWLTIGYEDQLKIKEEQVKEAFYSILKYLQTEQNPPNPLYQGGIEQDLPTRSILAISTSAIASARDDKVESLSSQVAHQLTSSPAHQPNFHPIIPSPEIYGYRNKVEFSWGKYISDREGVHDDFRFGFHAQGQFDRIENCTYCALADEEVNAVFSTVDTLSRESGLPTYDPKTGVGFWRHLVVRQGKKTGETMVIFSVNAAYPPPEKGESEGVIEKGIPNSVIPPNLPLSGEGLRTLFNKITRELTEKYPSITSIYFLENTGRADIVTGNPILLSGKPSIEDELLGMRFEIQPKSFFQVNTYGAEKLYKTVINHLTPNPSPKGEGDNLPFSEGEGVGGGGKVLLDLYAGTGTIGILLSKYFSEVYSVELVESASKDGEKNAEKNNVKNVKFICAKVEDFVKRIGSEFIIDNSQLTIVLDPPRDGMHPSALPHILSFGASEIIYVSCNPATLARDLEVFVGKNRDDKTEGLPRYRITDVTPVDMFPHTHHIETVVRMEKI